MTEDEILQIVEDRFNEARQQNAGDFRGQGPSADRNFWMAVRWLDANAPDTLENVEVEDLNTNRRPNDGFTMARARYDKEGTSDWPISQFRTGEQEDPNDPPTRPNPNWSVDSNYQDNAEYFFSSPTGIQEVQSIANTLGISPQDVLDYATQLSLDNSTEHEVGGHIFNGIMEMKDLLESGPAGRYVDSSGSSRMIPYNEHGLIREQSADDWVDMQDPNDPYDIVYREMAASERRESNRAYSQPHNRDRQMGLTAQEYMFQQYLEEFDLDVPSWSPAKQTHESSTSIGSKTLGPYYNTF